MSEELSTQIKIFQDHLQADEQEFVEGFERRKIRLEYSFVLFSFSTLVTHKIFSRI